MPRLLLIQGANMAWLGRREPEIYGTTTAAELDAMIRAHADANGVDIEIFYSHLEGEAIGKIYASVDAGIDGLIMNPAGFSHSGYALRDCIKGCAPLPYVEVHMSNIEKRGITSRIAEAANGVVAGFGTQSYILGIDAMLAILKKG